MKKFIIILFSLFLTNNIFAEIKVPGSGGINYWNDFEKFYKKQLKKSQKKKQKLIFYGSTGEGGWATGYKIVKDISDKVHEQAYKNCIKGAKKYTQNECFLFAINDKIVWTNIDEPVASRKMNLEIDENDKKPGRFFEDQPDVNDDYQIHFNYLLAKDSEDRELDISGKMEKIILMANKWMEISTSKNKKGDKVPRKYKLDYRSDGKLDITFIRMDKNFENLHKWANNDITPFLYKGKDQTNSKKIYFNFADINSVDGGEAGVGFGSIFLRNKSVSTDKRKAAILLHELLHTQGMGTNCMPWVKSSNLKSHDNHLKNRDKRTMLNSVDPGSPKIGRLYSHDIDKCPQFKDSVYLTPTRENAYDPYKIFCLFELGKYKHPNYLKVLNKLKEAGRYDWKTRFAPSCSTRIMSKDSQGYYLLGVEGNILKKINY
ncbi:hypothetical protein N9366_00585 [Candidatus Pelagibacter sp.]|nr:hypothetical protein [Candidatus Pelagibacter sp.]